MTRQTRFKKVVNSTDVTQEEPEKTTLSEPRWSPTHQLWTPSGISSALSKSLCLLLSWLQEKVSQVSPAETGGGKVVSKKHLNRDKVEAVPESMENEATESHDDQKAMEAGSPVLGPSKKVKSSEETVNVDKDDSTEDKADTLDQGQQLRPKL